MPAAIARTQKPELALELTKAAEIPDHADITIRARDITLLELRRKAEINRERQAKAFLDLAERVTQLCCLVPRRSHQLAIMTRDWQLSRAEASRILRLRNLSAFEKILYAEQHVSPEMIVALQKADLIIREEAHLLIQAGRILHPSDLRMMKARRDAANPDSTKILRDKHLKRQTKKSGYGHLAEFKQLLARYVRSLSIAYMRLDWTGRERRMAFLRQTSIKSARWLIDEFDRLFSSKLPVIHDWDRCATSDHGLMLAKARLSLERLSRDEYLLPDLTLSEYGHIELSLIQALAALADVDVSHLPYHTEALHIEAFKAATGIVEPDESHCQEESPQVLTSLEICSGAGGAAIGLHAAGFRSVGLIERNPDAVNTLIANNQLGPVFERDVRIMDFSVYEGKIDLFAGGVPCQPHSSLGDRQGENDERDLFAYSVEVIRRIKPSAVVLENVSGFGQRQTAAYRARIMAELHDAGYDAELFAIRACDYGLGQARPRLVLVALRDGLMSRFKMPPVLTPVPVTLGAALRDLMGENGWQGADVWAERADSVCPTIVGGSEKSGQMGFSSSFQRDDWRRLGIDPSQLAAEAPPADAPSDHLPRLTLRMGATLQGFPRDWIFEGNKAAQRRQVANAFPPILACAIGLAVREALTGVAADYKSELRQDRIEKIGHRSIEFDEPGSSETRKERKARKVSGWTIAQELELPTGDAPWRLFLENFPAMAKVMADENKRRRRVDRAKIRDAG